MNKLILLGLIIALLVYGLSAASYAYPIINYLGFAIIVVLIFSLAFSRYLPWALAILFGELAFGGNGYLFACPLGEVTLSLRMVIFIAVIGGWVVGILRHKISIRYPRVILVGLLGLLIVLIINSIRAISSGGDIAIIFADVNGYVYWLAALPIIFIIWDIGVLRSWLRVMVGATVAAAILVGGVALDFNLLRQGTPPDLELIIAKRAEQINPEGDLTQTIFWDGQNLQNDEHFKGGDFIYRWAKERGIIEVSYLQSGWYRVYHRSSIYFILTIAIILSGWKSGRGWRWKIPVILMAVLGLLLGNARSLWLGALAAILFLGLFWSWKKTVLGLVLFAVLLAGLGLVAPTYFNRFIGSRMQSIIDPQGEYAASARLAMLGPAWEAIKGEPLLGPGPGYLLKYFSPAPENYGWVKKYMIEWGYLDLWLDIGLVGLVFMAVLIWGIFKRGRMEGGTRICLLSVLVAILVIQITTPYLNHPLGIALICLVAAGGGVLKKDRECVMV